MYSFKINILPTLSSYPQPTLSSLPTFFMQVPAAAPVATVAVALAPPLALALPRKKAGVPPGCALNISPQQESFPVRLYIYPSLIPLPFSISTFSHLLSYLPFSISTFSPPLLSYPLVTWAVDPAELQLQLLPVVLLPIRCINNQPTNRPFDESIIKSIIQLVNRSFNRPIEWGVG